MASVGLAKVFFTLADEFFSSEFTSIDDFSFLEKFSFSDSSLAIDSGLWVCPLLKMSSNFF